MKERRIGRVESVSRTVFKIKVRLLKNILLFAKRNPTTFILRETCKELENTDYALSYRIRPQRAEEYNIIPNVAFGENMAVILQGPIRKENHFTLETIRLYKKMYPKLIIIVSTWCTEDEEVLEKIEKSGAYVVKSKLPNEAGHLNINYQIISSRAGIKKARELGAEYICKSRTDQRVSKKNAFEFMYNLLNTFPSNYANQNKRLIVVSVNYGNLFYPYFLSDFIYFGTAEEVGRVFDVSLRNEKIEKEADMTRRDLSKIEYAPEVYLIKNYLKNIGFSCEDTVERYWYAVKNYLITLDFNVLDIQWPKYEMKYQEHAMMGDYFGDDSTKLLKTANFDFLTWLNLYSGTMQYSNEYEKFADVII